MLKQARGNAKLSQQALASRAGVSRTAVARMETLAKGDERVGADSTAGSSRLGPEADQGRTPTHD